MKTHDITFSTLEIDKFKECFKYFQGNILMSAYDNLALGDIIYFRGPDEILIGRLIREVGKEEYQEFLIKRNGYIPEYRENLNSYCAIPGPYFEISFD